jgi:hypothetical protein
MKKLYTFENVQAKALEFNLKIDFIEKAEPYYRFAQRTGIIDIVCSHMPKNNLVGHIPANKKWTPETLLEEAKKYNSIKELKDRSLGTYKAAWKLNILDEVCAHMKRLRRTWTDEELAIEAKKYLYKSHFEKESQSAYHTAHRRGLIDSICSHMQPMIVKKDNKKIVKKRKLWTLETAKQEAIKYKTRTELLKNALTCYRFAVKNNCLDEICSHMPENALYGMPPPNKKWTKETIFEESKKYENRYEFKKYNPSAYNAAKKSGLLSVCYPVKKHFRNTPYTKEEIVKKVKEFSTNADLKADSPGLYMTILKREDKEQILSSLPRSANISSAEQSLFNLIKEKYPKTQRLRDKKIKIENKPHIQGLDIDIYIPELRKGIEFDGTYWHSVEGLKRGREHWPKEDLENYHRIKDNHFLSKGVQILHIKEEDWIQDKELCLKKCFEFLGL